MLYRSNPPVSTLNPSVSTKFRVSTIQWYVAFLLCEIAVMLPFWVVSFPPAMDLPQHMSQVTLFLRLLQQQDTTYFINWFGPNNLIYAVMGLVRLIVPVATSGKITLMVLTMSWVGALFYVARAHRRPLTHTILCTFFVFNFSMYWGFLNFLIGWPIWLLWFHQSSKPLTRRGWLGLFILMFLLYEAHVLWFLVAGLWMLIATLYHHQEEWRTRIYRLTAMVPMSLVVFIWYPAFSSSWGGRGFDLAPHWNNSLLTRLTLPHAFLLGGIHGPWELIIAVTLAGWLLLAIITRHGEFFQKLDKPMVTAAAIFLVMGFCAPDKYMNTVYFGTRWLPMGMILLLLAFPQPKLPLLIPVLRNGVLLLGVLLYYLLVSTIWIQFERQELSGLQEAINATPVGASVIGLDFVKESAWIKWRPFVHTVSYLEALKGSPTNFSLARHASMLVQYTEAWQPTWAYDLEWFAEFHKDSDIQEFDYALINGDQATHMQFTAKPYLEPVTTQGAWRLYHVMGRE